MGGRKLVGGLIASTANIMKSVNNFTGDIDLILDSTKKVQLGHSLLEFNPKMAGNILGQRLTQLTEFEQSCIGIGHECLLCRAGQLQQQVVMGFKEAEIGCLGQCITP